ncbi:hypothetical protein AB0I28_34690 [Phytomonospora sp. NPDC050363]|uniref:hypothetical protein n=1 Tax=Phytomonospora sp. NPDC050363 TaxID=3155642 RepID=UPI0034017581
METLRLILRYAHLIGFAVLLGGACVQYVAGRFRINATMAWGAGIQLLTGILLSAPLGRDEADKPDPAKLAVKGVVAVLIGIMVLVPYFRKRKAADGAVVHKGHFIGILVLTLGNAAVATFWR